MAQEKVAQKSPALDSIAWENWLQLREDGYDLVYLMRYGEEKDAWDEWMEGFEEELKASYDAYRSQKIQQKKLRKKTCFFLGMTLAKLESLEALLTGNEQDSGAEEEIGEALKCIKGYIRHTVRMNDLSGQSDPKEQNDLDKQGGKAE